MDEDRLINLLVDIKEKLNHLVTNERFDEFNKDFSDRLQVITVILRRLDDGRFFSVDR